MTTFTAAIRNHIDKSLRRKSFCVRDFSEIVAEFGKTNKSISHVINDLKKHNLIIDAKDKKYHVPGSTKFYQVVVGAKFEFAPPKAKSYQHAAWLKSLSDKELHTNECSKRLGEALDRMGL